GEGPGAQPALEGTGPAGHADLHQGGQAPARRGRPPQAARRVAGRVPPGVVGPARGHRERARMSTTEIQVRHRTVMDDEARHVARVYAEALYKAAEEAGEVEAVLGELGELTDGVFGQDPGAELFFASPAVGRDRKEH